MILVACTSTKLAEPAPARLLYCSPWFVKARRYAELSGERWRILSALHGLVHPQQQLEPYAVTLKDVGPFGRREWGAQVYAALSDILEPREAVTVLAGRLYREHLVPRLLANGHRVLAPLAGMGIGRQLRYLTLFSGQARQASPDDVVQVTR